jgi:hypothetical protein
LTIQTNLLDTWDIRISRVSESRLVAQTEALARAVAIADSFVATDRPDAAKIVERSAGWRLETPTDKQKALLAARGIKVPDGLTKGQASQMISQIFGASPSRRER